MSVANKQQFKLLFIGDSGVGKTTFINRHRTGEFTVKFNSTAGSEIQYLTFNTNKGETAFYIWDTAGQEKYDKIVEKSCKDADGAVIMFDVTSKVSYRNVKEWYDLLIKHCPNIPIVLCGNKVDCKDRKVHPSDISFHREHQLQYYDISAKSNYNFEKPFLYLIGKLLKDDNVNFIEKEALAPPEIKELPDINKSKHITIGERIEVIQNGCNSEITLKLAVDIANDEKLWKEFLNLYYNKGTGQTIFVFSDKKGTQFVVV